MSDVDFKYELKQLGERVASLKDQIQTEEATKNAMVMPVLKMLGYDVFNPLEVVPEFIADIGIKKGEKIDYAIMRDGVPIILVECKHWNQNLNLHDGQLLRYFHVSKAKFGVLTNGIEYRFYSDLVQPNRMDEKPFLELNITELRDGQIEELKKFHKSFFDAESITNSASELKYSNELKQLLNNELTNPTTDFVKLFTRQVYPGALTQKVLEQFSILIQKSFKQYINDMISDKLKSVLDNSSSNIEIQPESVTEPVQQVITTEEELEGYYIVKSILRKKIVASRIVHRDAQTYFAILLDDNNRKCICRLYFNGTKKYIVIFDSAKKELKFEIDKVEEIYNYEQQLFNIVEFLDDPK